MWGLSTQALQAITGWSLAVAGIAAVVGLTACILAAFTSARVADEIRNRAQAEIAEARQHAAAASAAVSAARARAQVLAETNSTLQTALAAQVPDDGLPRRMAAFADLVRGRTAHLTLVVGPGDAARETGQALRLALKTADVPVRWCRLKPAAARETAQGLAVYADPAAPEAVMLLKALTSAGFTPQLLAARRDDPGMPSPSIFIAAGPGAPRAASLSVCTPMVGDWSG